MSKKKKYDDTIDKRRLISSVDQINEYRAKIKMNTDKHISSLLQDEGGMGFLRKLKFHSDVGYDPLFEQQMNFLEQVNQVWTYMVCLSAVEYFLNNYPGKRFWVCFGTKNGYDVESEDKSIICECFAQTAPSNNDKLRKEAKKIHTNTTAQYKYVIFYVYNKEPGHLQNVKRDFPEIEYIELDTI